MRDVNRSFEAAVRRDPANWFWVHRRWKELTVNAVMEHRRYNSPMATMPAQSPLGRNESGAELRILVRGTNWLGDAVMTTPALLQAAGAVSGGAHCAADARETGGFMGGAPGCG